MAVAGSRLPHCGFWLAGSVGEGLTYALLLGNSVCLIVAVVKLVDACVVLVSSNSMFLPVLFAFRASLVRPKVVLNVCKCSSLFC